MQQFEALLVLISYLSYIRQVFRDYCPVINIAVCAYLLTKLHEPPPHSLHGSDGEQWCKVALHLNHAHFILFLWYDYKESW